MCPLTVWELEILERIKDIIMAMQYQRLAKEKAEKEAWIEAHKKKKKRVAQRITRMKSITLLVCSFDVSMAGPF